MGRRKRFGFQKRPVNIYEAHASSWKLKEDGQPYTFKELKEELIPYLVEMNYTHVEFMPLMAHPLWDEFGVTSLWVTLLLSIPMAHQKNFKIS